MAKTIRCAIYTRKSTEEGLEQNFNSLDAQRESCEAYIKSQTHEGWKIIQKQYNDGGYSGGTMNRPAFQELLDDIKEGKIDIVVVYKVDRLTRSLMDFSKIIEVFDKHSASFVSITQHFNTTTSMGRLTLNILLSFAQFEREVTGERIRDKFAASAKKGLWITGIPPLGYIKDDNALKIDNTQAPKILTIFEKYLELKSVSTLKDYLDKNKIFTRSNKPFSKGNLYHILSNKVYLGKIVKGKNVYEGLHKALISTDIFNEVQKQLNDNCNNQTGKERNLSNAMLQGKMFDEKNNFFTPSKSTGRSGKRYCYYLNKEAKAGKLIAKDSIIRIHAQEIEDFVENKVKEYILNKKNILKLIKNCPIQKQEECLNHLKEIQPDKTQIKSLLNKIIIHKSFIEILIQKGALFKLITGFEDKDEMDATDMLNADETIILTFNIKIQEASRKGRTMTINDNGNQNKTLVEAIVKGFYYTDLIIKAKDKNKIPSELQTRNIRRLRKLRFLPPKLIEQIFKGNQNPDLTVEKLCEIGDKNLKSLSA